MQVAPNDGRSLEPDVSAAKSQQAAGYGHSPPAPGTPVDKTGDALIRELAAADLLKLTQILQPERTPEIAAQLADLLNQTVRAIADGRIEYAIGRLAEVATLDPAHADDLRSAPALEAIRPNVDRLLGQLTSVAKVEAESKLSQAEGTLHQSGVPKLLSPDIRPEALVHAARTLFETGGYANYLRTSELSQAVIRSAYWGETIPLQVPAAPAPKPILSQNRRTAVFSGSELILIVLGLVAFGLLWLSAIH